MAVVCPRCDQPIHFAAGPFCSHCGAPIVSNMQSSNPTRQTPESDRIAWETDAFTTNPLQALYATFVEIIRYPDSFFRKITSYESTWTPAWIFALTSGGIGLAASWFWSMLFIHYGASIEFLEPIFGGETTTPYMLLFAPILLSLQLFCSAAYVKIMFRFTRLKRAPFLPIFRIVCYAEAPMVLQIIPVIGSIIATLLWAFTILTGLRHLYGAGRFRVFMQLLLPLFIAVTFLALLLTAGIVGGMMAGAGSLIDPWSIIDQFRK